jgi:hypothetical protein
MTSPEDVSAQLELARQQSKAVWDTTAPGWHAWREQLWQSSQPVSEWMIRKLDPQPGDTLLELAAGLADTGFCRPFGDRRKPTLKSDSRKCSEGRQAVATRC